ncbi:ankyrin repeat-containing domain protein [Aspergillus floccosus]
MADTASQLAYEIASLLAVSRSDPQSISGLVSSAIGSGTAASSPETRLLHLLVANETADIPEDVLPQVIKAMSKAHINVQDDTGKTALALAVTRNRVEIVSLLLRHHASVDIDDKYGQTPLHRACRSGNAAIVQLLLAHGASIKARTHLGDTPLLLACTDGQVDVARILIDRGADVEAVDNEGFTPLKKAAHQGSVLMVRLLLEAGAEVDKVYKDCDCVCTPLISAAAQNHVDVMEILVDNDADIDKPGDDGSSALNRACQFGYENAVELLLSRNANVESLDSDKWTPLFTASRWGYEKLVKLLIKSGANVNTADTDGWTPLYAASLPGHQEVIVLLLKAGADVNAPCHNGETPLARASREGMATAVKILLENHAAVNTADKEGATPLHQACFHGNFHTTKLLLKHGAKVTMSDNCGRTPLHRASHQGYDALVELLLDHHAPVNATDNSGWTPLHIASSNSLEDVSPVNEPEVDDDKAAFLRNRESRIMSAQYDKVVMLLLEAQASVNMKTEKDETPLHLALRKMHNQRAILLAKGMEAKDIAVPDGSGVTALYLASKHKNAEMMRVFLSKLDTVDLERDIVPYTFVWTSKTERTHDIVQLLTQKEKIPRKRGTNTRVGTQGALYWAAVRGKKDLVWQLLCNTVPTPVAEQRRRAAETAVKDILNQLRAGKKGDEGEEALQNQGPHGTAKTNRHEQGHLKPTYHLILDMLQDPPMIHTSASHTEYQMPSSEGKRIGNFEAVIVDFFAQKDRTGFLQRFRGVEEVIYDKGPKRIMIDARETMQDSSFSRVGHDKVFSEDDLQLRWIHLPANNLGWMRHLALRVFLDEGRSNSEFNTLDMFVENSWMEFPDSISAARFMKPSCAREDHLTALYIPYLTFATQHEGPTQESRKYNSLLETYKGETVHGSRTLDEAYYQFAVGGELDVGMRFRNKDQVISRWIHGEMKNRDVWTLLRVDQLWLWVIDSNTVITSSTHRMDDHQDPVITRILYDLIKRNGGKGQRQPSTTEELSRVIVNGCVRFFDQALDSGSSVEPETGIPASIRQIFSDSINQASIEEARLFYGFTKENMREERSAMSGPRSVNSTAALLRNVKDIRDELNILRTIASYQQVVQQELGEKGGSASRVIADIDEMNKRTETIYEAVHATLNLEQNEIALSQSEETIQQGRTIMLFTVTTIIFLPMSFLTSLFALDVADFQHDKSGDLKYTPGWIFPIIFGVSAGVWVPLIIYAFWDQLAAFFPAASTVLHNKKGKRHRNYVSKDPYAAYSPRTDLNVKREGRVPYDSMEKDEKLEIRELEPGSRQQ